ncbi:hypothetical protein BdWA1_002197 [Babesia duncani]|uniref:Uncharacterized protein n=1 Tax=Babesia duncani TaxID=323732 RepID=A0AAD9PM69_9APIC|nr:hypothetical protein BdWA1_002197 [Babesia duncani]
MIYYFYRYIRKVPREIYGDKLLCDFFDSLKKFSNLDLNTQANILNVFNTTVVADNCDALIEHIREYIDGIRVAMWDNPLMMDFVKDKMLNDPLDSLVLQAQKKEEELRRYREIMKNSIITILEDLHMCTQKLYSLHSNQLFKWPWKESVMYIGDAITKLEKSIDGLGNLEIMKNHPNLSIAANGLFDDYIKALNQYKETFTKEHEKMLNMIKAQENALRGNS